jgi:asparagine synthase (glutamine-hydrolysing)
MCGFIYVQSENIKKGQVNNALQDISYRGPDFSQVLNPTSSLYLSHCRLSILDIKKRSHQPLVSNNGRYAIIYNGEIYNYKYLEKRFNLKLKTTSDTEVILEGYSKIGNKIFDYLEGMFSLVIHDYENNTWVASRDPFGIKPLYIYKKNNDTIISSETKAITSLVNVTPSIDSINEWKKFRSPLPGKSFFNEIEEILPGIVLQSNGIKSKNYQLEQKNSNFNQQELNSLLLASVKSHTIADVECTSLVSGGLDSSIICHLTQFENYYSIGLPDNNEFEETIESSKILNKKINNYEISFENLKENWINLTKLKGEPLLLPNEGLIFEICKKFINNEKVFLTGEGADELFFGYDRIFRWSIFNEFNLNEFLKQYSYSSTESTPRFLDFIHEIKKNKNCIEFLEDFFYNFHLPVLLRRMDFSSMAASKEARVPFITKKLVDYLYRIDHKNKIDNKNSKLPLRTFASNNGLNFLLKRKKVGFSALEKSENNYVTEYKKFRKIILETLKWDEYEG